MVVEQGDIFWLDFSPAKGSEPKGHRPGLVIQCDAFNSSRISTVVVAAITSNLRYEQMPGNVRLAKGEAKMPKPCVINISQIKTIDRSYLQRKIGRISDKKLKDVKKGLKLIFDIV